MRYASLLLLLLAACAHAPLALVRGPQGELHVDDGGRGAALPILFVHGNGANLRQWHDTLVHERASRRAVALDLRGMGLSEPAANGDYSLSAMADDLDAVANALGLKRFILVGHSYGSHVVAAYAARHPDRVAAVVHVEGGGNVTMPEEAVKKFRAAIERDKEGVVAQWFAPILVNAQAATHDAVLASVHATNTQAFAGALEGMTQVDLATLVAAYKGPQFVIFAIPLDGPNTFHGQFPDFPSRGIDGVSHWLMMDKPDEFNLALDGLLGSVPDLR